MAVVELIDRVRVSDKDHIEIDFNFQDCFQSALRQIQSAGCTVCMDEAGRTIYSLSTTISSAPSTNFFKSPIWFSMVPRSLFAPLSRESRGPSGAAYL